MNEPSTVTVQVTYMELRTSGTIPQRFVFMNELDSVCTTYAMKLLECSSASNSSR